MDCIDKCSYQTIQRLQTETKDRFAKVLLQNIKPNEAFSYLISNNMSEDAYKCSYKCGSNRK